jgi:hypothetical protein
MSLKATSCGIVLVCLIVVNCCPIITNVNPERGPVGTEVVIDGRRFESTPSENTVTFGGAPVPASDILQASTTRLLVKVPVEAQTGRIRVANQYCGGQSPRPFTVEQYTGKPDLLPKNLAFSASGALSFELINLSENIVPLGQGRLTVYIDGLLLKNYTLAGLPDQSFRNPGGSVTLHTGLRMAGQHRRVGVMVDPDGVIDESNEFQNTLTRTLTPPVVTGPDLIVADLALETPSRLRVVVKNIGSAPSPANLQVSFDAALDEEAVGTLSTAIPGLAVRGSTQVVYTAPSSIPNGSRVRVTLKTRLASDEIDNTNNSRAEILPYGPSLSPYAAVLGRPKIRNSIIWECRVGDESRVALAYASWTAAQKADLNDAILALERGDPYALSAPPALINEQMISVADAWKIYLAHVAQSLWVEVNQKVPWRLARYTDDQLLLLFDSRKLLTFWQDLYAFDTYNMGSSTAWNPRVSYEFLHNLGMIRPTPMDTIYAFTDWMRGHVVHIVSGQDRMQLYGYAGLPPADKMLYALDGNRHVVEGCWGVSGLYGATLRAVNIPVERNSIWLNGGYHCRPYFPAGDRGLAHGDDAHSALIPSGVVVPSSQIFFNQTDIQTLFLEPVVDCVGGQCNTASEQASYNQRRILLGLAYDNMTDDLLYPYSQYGAAYLNDSLRGRRINNVIEEYVKPYFTESERASMVQAVENRVRQIGNGDLQGGKSIVITRWTRFVENK